MEVKNGTFLARTAIYPYFRCPQENRKTYPLRPKNRTMFIPTMTDAEILQEAKKDFLEIGTPIKIAFERFIRLHRDLLNKSEMRFNGSKVSLINKNVETKKWKTRRNNTWTARFGYANRGQNSILMQCHIYTAVRRERGTEYIFLNSPISFMAERFTMHFIERYKERYLVPNNIDIGAMPPPLYFQLHNLDCILGRYYKTTDIGVEESRYKKFWIAPQGIYVTDYIDGMLTYITFMDKENLSLLKRQVYEEEIVWNQVLRAQDLKVDDNVRRKACYQLIYAPDTIAIVERFLKRNYSNNDDRRESIAYLKEVWPSLQAQAERVQTEFEEKEKEEMRKSHQTGKIASSGGYNPYDS